MKLQKGLLLLTSICLLISFSNCNKHLTKAYIETPFSSIDIEFSTFKTNTESDNVLDIGHGSSIEIPASAFVNSNNEAIVGEVDISFREFQEAEDILIAGIPMAYDSGGVTYNFQTAGMFEINASQNGEEVFIAKGKKLKVNLASNTEGQYSFYKLDTNAANWVYKGNNATELNKNKLELNTDSISAANIPPTKPKKFSKKDPIINLEIDCKDFPELKEFSSVLWVYSDQNNNPEIKSIDWVFRSKWTDIKLLEYDKENSLYLLRLNRNDAKTEFLVSPVLNNSDYNRALDIFNKKMSKYNEILADKEFEVDRLENERSFIRSYEIMDFGIYNWDLFYKRKDFITFNARLKFDKEYDLDANNIVIYLITANNKAVIKYDRYSLSSFRFCPTDDNKLVAILPGNKIAVYSNKKFKRLYENELKAGSITDYEFDMTIIKKEITSPDEFKESLASI